MAFAQNREVNVPSSVSNGTAWIVRDQINKKVVFLTVATGGIYSIQGSRDGTTWVNIATGINATGTTSVDTMWLYLRIVTTGYTSGSGTAYYSGFDPANAEAGV